MKVPSQAAGATSKVTALLAGVPTWAWVVIAVVVVAGLAVGGYLLWRSRQKKTGAAPAPPAAAPAPSSSSLSSLWKAFLAAQPRASRDDPVFVVLGDAGAGKTRLIDARVDLKKQAAGFRKSAEDSPLLQLYPGDDLLVQEISSTVLHATDDATKSALAALFGEIASQAPTAVLVLDATALVAGPPDKVKELAQLARGKVDLLSGVRKSPVSLRLCLTHLDQIDGYEELASVLAAQGVDQPLLIGSDTSGAGLAASLQPLEAWLPCALTSLPPGGFAKVVRFFDAMRAVLDALSPAVAALTAPDDLSITPVLDGLSLSALRPADHLGEPFAVDRRITAALAADRRGSDGRVRSICAGALVFTTALMGLFYGYHNYRLHQAEAAVKAFVRAADPTSRATSDALDETERVAGEELSDLRGPSRSGRCSGTASPPTSSRRERTSSTPYARPISCPCSTAGSTATASPTPSG